MYNITAVICVLYCFLWNNLHTDMHDVNMKIPLKEGMPHYPGLMSKGLIYNWLWKNHALHHLQKEGKGNYNIIFPGADFLFCSYNSKFDNRKFCEKHRNDKKTYERICKDKTRIARYLTDADVLPKH
jgi:hypothetical protein